MRSDAELVKLIKMGDKEAFNELYNKYKQLIDKMACRFKLKYGLTINDAEDIIQETWKRVLEKGGLRGEFPPWAYEIMHNLVYDLLKKRRESIPIDEVEKPIPSTEPGPDETAEAKEFAEILTDVMASSLTDQQYEIYRLKLIGEKNKDIAEKLGTTPNNVNSQLSQARKKVKEIIKSKYGWSEDEVEAGIRNAQKVDLEYLNDLLLQKRPHLSVRTKDFRQRQCQNQYFYG